MLQALSYLEKTFGAGTVRKYLYAVGAAPYFNTEWDTSSVDAMIAGCRHNIDSSIFGEFSNEENNGNRMGNKLEEWLGEAGQYGLKLYAYEGGPDMDYTTGSGGIKNSCMRDPRMVDLCVNYWTKWYSRYGADALFCFFRAEFNNSGLYTLGENMDTLSTRQKAMNLIINNPCPPPDTNLRMVVPGIIDARKILGYWSNWKSNPALQYLRQANADGVGGSARWMFRATISGQYKLSILRACQTSTSIDIWLDDRLVHDNKPLPSTGTQETFLWSADQGITIPIEMTSGIHVMRIVFNEENGSYSQLKFDLLPTSIKTPAPHLAPSHPRQNPHPITVYTLDGRQTTTTSHMRPTTTSATRSPACAVRITEKGIIILPRSMTRTLSR